MNPATLTNLQSKVTNIDSLPAIPTVMEPLLSALRRPPDRFDLAEIIELISLDKTIAVQCLRVANSPLYGRRHDVETIKSAVIILGTQRIHSIVLGRCLNQTLPRDRWVCDPASFWRHSLGCALVSRKLAGLVGYADPEKAYLAGLLHDLGILVNCLICPKEFSKSLQVASERRAPLDQVEYAEMGFSHADSGKLLAERWHIPCELIEVIETHHDVSAAHKAKALVSLVHLSDLICRVRQLGHGHYEAISVDLCGEEAWSILLGDYPSLADVDIARLTFDVDGAMDEITELVNAVFLPGS